MDHFVFRDGALHCEDVAVSRIAESAGTPVFVYSRATLVDHYERLRSAFATLDPLICYAIKSSSTLTLCRQLHELGANRIPAGHPRNAILTASILP